MARSTTSSAMRSGRKSWVVRRPRSSAAAASPCSGQWVASCHSSVLVLRVIEVEARARSRAAGVHRRATVSMHGARMARGPPPSRSNPIPRVDDTPAFCMDTVNRLRALDEVKLRNDPPAISLRGLRLLLLTSCWRRRVVPTSPPSAKCSSARARPRAMAISCRHDARRHARRLSAARLSRLRGPAAATGRRRPTSK